MHGACETATNWISTLSLWSGLSLVSLLSLGSVGSLASVGSVASVASVVSMIRSCTFASSRSHSYKATAAPAIGSFVCGAGTALARGAGFLLLVAQLYIFSKVFECCCYCCCS